MPNFKTKDGFFEAVQNEDDALNRISDLVQSFAGKKVVNIRVNLLTRRLTIKITGIKGILAVHRDDWLVKCDSNTKLFVVCPTDFSEKYFEI